MVANPRRSGCLLLALAALVIQTAGAAPRAQLGEAALQQPESQPPAPPPDEPPTEPAEDLTPGRVQVSPVGTVEMHVADLPLSTVLQMLSLQSRRNIIATPAVQGTVTADLYEVTFEEALEAILMANRCGYRTQGSFIYVYTDEELAQLAVAEQPLATRVMQVYYVTAAEAVKVLTPLLSDLGSLVGSTAAEQGIAPDASAAGGDTSAAFDYVVVRDYPANLAEIERVLNEIDVQPQQVLLEATILRATLNDDNALGIDFTMVGGVDLEVLGSTSTGITDLLTGPLPSNRFEKFNAAVETDFRGTVPQGGITIGIIKDHVGVFIRALEQVTDIVLLANPKILALNKQKGQVIVGRRDGYITTTVTETQAIQSIEFLETGTQLIFRPYIGKNGYVRMELHPEDSIGGLTAANLPFETTTELTTNVLLRDGQTILIGGLFREVTTSTRGQVPLLGDIPGIGPMFRSTKDVTQREEVIILLTVHIIKHDDAYAQAGGRQLEDIERVRVGLRRGMGWTGRERLAQAHYRRALEHFATGDSDRALWDVRLSLHNNPQFLSAINLREEILHQREWDDEGSITRDFVARLIDEEASPGVEAPRFGRPAPPFVSPKHMRGPSGFESVEEGSGP